MVATGLRFVASDVKATYSPVALIVGWDDGALAPVPRPLARLTSVVVASTRSRTYTVPMLSGAVPGASEPPQVNATCVPSSLRAGSWQPEWVGSPAAPVARLASVSVPVSLSFTYTLLTRSSSSVLSPSDCDVKATKRPSLLTDQRVVKVSFTGVGSASNSE